MIRNVPSSRGQLASHERQEGLSLVELLIATALGLIIVTALTQLFSDVSRTNREMAKTNSQIENARFAIQFLRNDIQHAGFWGEFIPQFDDLMFAGAPADAPTLVPDPCLAYSLWTPAYVNSLLGIGVQAYESVPGGVGGTCNGLGIFGTKLANTDLVVVRHADTCVPGDANCDSDVSGPLYFQASNCAAELDSGSFYSLDPNSYPLTERNCTTTAAKRRFIQNIYFVGDNGDGIPTLMRSEFGSGSVLVQQPAQALVQGIERFRVELGIDSFSETGALVSNSAPVNWVPPNVWTVPTNRGDGIPDDSDPAAAPNPDGGFKHCSDSSPCTEFQLSNTVAVKLYVLARANEPSPGYVDSKTYTLGSQPYGPFNDNFKRHVFSTTIRINNVAGRRETP